MPQRDQKWKHEKISSPLRARLNRWLFDLHSASGRRVNKALMAVIIASVILGMLGTIEHVDQQWQTLFYILEFGVTLIFVIEYLARLYSARKPLTYALSFYGLVDLATILPLIIFGDANTAIRMLRVFRLLKLIRYLKALQIFVASLRDVYEIMVVVIAGISIIVLVAGNLIYFLEPQNIANAFEGCWWSLITMTTVGYGDIVPQSAAGRIVASVLILIGVTMFAMLTGAISVKVHHALSYQNQCPECERMVAQEFTFCPFCSANQHGHAENNEISQSDSSK